MSRRGATRCTWCVTRPATRSRTLWRAMTCCPLTCRGATTGRGAVPSGRPRALAANNVGGGEMTATEPAQTRTGGYRDIREYMDALEAAGMLKHVTAEVDLKYEIGAIAARSLEEGGPALVFENIKGYPDMPLVVNLVSNNRQLGLAFGTGPDEAKIYQKLVDGMRNRIPSRIVRTGPVKEEIERGDEVD